MDFKQVPHEGWKFIWGALSKSPAADVAVAVAAAVCLLLSPAVFSSLAFFWLVSVAFITSEPKVNMQRTNRGATATTAAKKLKFHNTLRNQKQQHYTSNIHIHIHIHSNGNSKRNNNNSKATDRQTHSININGRCRCRCRSRLCRLSTFAFEHLSAN